MKTATVLLVLEFAFALIIVSYPFYARPKGWPVGQLINEPGVWLYSFVLVGLLGSPIFGLLVGPWWLVLLVPSVGWLSALVLTEMLRWHVQMVAVVGLPLCWLLSFGFAVL